MWVGFASWPPVRMVWPALVAISTLLLTPGKAPWDSPKQLSPSGSPLGAAVFGGASARPKNFRQYFQTPEGGPISEACEDLLRQTLQYDPGRCAYETSTVPL